MNINHISIGKSWQNALEGEFSKPYFKELASFLHKEEEEGHEVYPPEELVFNAFIKTPPEKVKVVILGQDPYHGPGQAMGLSFAVPQDKRMPPSLRNIFKEIEADLGVKMSGTPDLTPWTEQGVLLLNAILTVRAHSAASHRKIGWETFTDATISYLSANYDGIVFMLWGNFAKGKKKLIDTSKHYVLEAVHPSPLARGGFAGCRHFSKANEILESQGKTPIEWQL